MQGLHRQHGVLYSLLLEPGQGFSDKATSGFVLLRGIKGGEGKNVNGSGIGGQYPSAPLAISQ
jgi:hypothetical protein